MAGRDVRKEKDAFKQQQMKALSVVAAAQKRKAPEVRVCVVALMCRMPQSQPLAKVCAA